MNAGTGAGVLFAVDAGVVVDGAAGSGADGGIDKAGVTWHGMTAPIAGGAPEGCTPASGPGRGVRTVDIEECVDAGVGAADGAGIDAEDTARTRKAMAKMVL